MLMGPTGGRGSTPPFGSRACLPHLMMVFVDFPLKKSTNKGDINLKLLILMAKPRK